MLNNISWPDLLIAAESERELFEDVRIVTAKSQFYEEVYELAIMRLIQQSKQLDTDTINKTAQSIIDEHNPYITEYATINGDGAVVCIDVDHITDETVWSALDMLYLAVQQEGKWESTKQLTFPWSDGALVQLH
ncbi:MAG: hypothetical protein CTY12_04955 [Methylotenera sp.]|nr:MAG: hypothetical protein CTY12_04955 [Methylotenera sp.]